MLVELSVMEQRYQAVLAVVQDGWPAPDTGLPSRSMDPELRKISRKTWERLSHLTPEARRELALVLISPDDVRADVIRQCYERPEGRVLAECPHGLGG